MQGESWLLDLVALIVAGSAPGALPSNPMTPVAMASIIAGMLVFLALGILVAYASYQRKKESDWHVAEWHRAEADSVKKRDREERDLTH